MEWGREGGWCDNLVTYTILVKFVDGLLRDAGPDVHWDAHGEFPPFAGASAVYIEQ